jgi:hypothetical protein
MPVQLPDNVTHNNPSYPIVLSEDLGGTARVISGTLNNANLVAISSFKRSLGTLIYSSTDVMYYKYVGADLLDVNWGNTSNWVEISDAAAWGNISGNLADQTDLTNALNGKASLTGSYSNPSWIASLAYSKITSVPSFELSTNKSTDVTLGGVSPSSSLYTSEYAVKTYVDNQIAAAQAGIPTFEIDMFANYKIYESDEAGTTTFVGTIKATNGNWLITKYVDNSGDITATYANESNNSTYTTPSTAWTNRTSLNYTAINNLTDI